MCVGDQQGGGGGRGYLGRRLRLVVGQQVVVELWTVELALEGPGGGGVGLGHVAVVAGGAGGAAAGELGGELAVAVHRRLLRETLVRQEVGVNRLVSRRSLDWRRGDERRGWLEGYLCYVRACVRFVCACVCVCVRALETELVLL